MKPIVIAGDVLCGKLTSGIPRFSYQVIKYIDELLFESGEDLDIRVCYPADKTIHAPELRILNLVPLDLNGRKFGSDVLRRYIKNNSAVGCFLSPSFSFSKGGIICIHDLRALEYKEASSKKSYMIQKSLRWDIFFTKAFVITVSEYQKSRIKYFYKVPDNRIFVAPNGWEHICDIEPDMSIFDKLPFYSEGLNYYYSLGSVAKHKNYKWIHEIAKKNPEEYFVIAGNISKDVWGVDNQELNLPNVFFTGYVTDEENKALMMKCKAFLHPSKYEGFGIPPLEALALGKKIIISNATCLPEIYRNCAAYFDPDDYNIDLRNLEETPVDDPDSILAQYSWRVSAQRFISIFKELA